MGQSLNGFTLERRTATEPTETWAEYGEIVNVQPPTYSRDSIEDTTSKDTVEKFLASKILKHGNPTISIRFNPADAEAKHWTTAGDLLALAKAGTVERWRIPSGTLVGTPTSVTFTFDAFISEFNPGPMQNGAGWDADVTFQIVDGVTES